MNALQFTDDPSQTLVDLLTLLKHSRRLAITFQSRAKGATSEYSRRAGWLKVIF